MSIKKGYVIACLCLFICISYAYWVFVMPLSAKDVAMCDGIESELNMYYEKDGIHLLYCQPTSGFIGDGLPEVLVQGDIHQLALVREKLCSALSDFKISCISYVNEDVTVLDKEVSPGVVHKKYIYPSPLVKVCGRDCAL